MIKQVVPYLTFNGNAKEALEFFSQVFEGEIFDVQTYAQANMPVPDEAKDRIIHGRLRKDSLLIYVSDAFPGQDIQGGNSFSIAVDFDSKEDQRKVYDRLKEGGNVHMELQETFWDALYGKVQDKFGITWDLNFQAG